MELVVIAQVVLLAGQIVHRVVRLLAGLVARGRDNPVFRHHLDGYSRGKNEKAGSE